MTTFIRKLEAAWQANNSLLCVGLDPDPARIPAGQSVVDFLRGVVEASLVRNTRSAMIFFCSSQIMPSPMCGTRSISERLRRSSSSFSDCPTAA